MHSSKRLRSRAEHVVFILATTDADKLPPTIISRVQRFNFRAATESDAAKNLRRIADAEQIAIDDEAIALIAHSGNGSFRDSVAYSINYRVSVTTQLAANLLKAYWDLPMPTR